MLYEQDLTLKQYLNDVGKHPLLTAVEEKELSQVIHDSNKDEAVRKAAKDRLVVSNLKLVVKCALDYHQKIKRMSGMHLGVMDLIQAGNIGLMRAADLYKADRNVRFSSYAYYGIKRRMVTEVKESRFVRVPVDHFKHMAHLTSLEQKYGDSLTDEIIMEELHINEKILVLIKKNRGTTLSLDGLEEEVEHVIPIEPEDVELTSVRKEIKNYLFEKMKELNPRYRNVLFMKYFGNEEMTLQMIADKIGLTRERVRQILYKALRVLREKIEEEKAVDKISSSKVIDDIKSGKYDMATIATKKDKKDKKDKKEKENKNENTKKHTKPIESERSHNRRNRESRKSSEFLRGMYNA